MGNLTVGVTGSLIATILFLTFVVIINKFSAKAINLEPKLLHKDWIGRFAISSLSSMLFYLVFSYLFAVFYKWCGWVMGPTEVYVVIIAGISSPLINFIAFIFLAPQKWDQAIVVGVMSLFSTYFYMMTIVSLYSLVFRLMAGLPGL